jgi:hypothetical protein
MKFLIYLFCLLCFAKSIGQEKFKIKEVEGKNWKSTYFIINEKGKAVKQLDTTKYLICLGGYDYGHFAVFAIKGDNGWCAIDQTEHVLFHVYNTSDGEPSPDRIIENKIRIIDRNGKIGFADHTGKIIIKPQFEMVTSFYNGKAIIGEQCSKIPWGNHDEEEGGCHHYSIDCKRAGYINAKGEVIEVGDFTFEEIQKKINWKSPDW